MNLQSQLPNNPVTVVSNEFNKDSNRIQIKLKVHSVSELPDNTLDGSSIVQDTNSGVMQPRQGNYDSINVLTEGAGPAASYNQYVVA